MPALGSAAARVRDPFDESMRSWYASSGLADATRVGSEKGKPFDQQMREWYQAFIKRNPTSGLPEGVQFIGDTVFGKMPTREERARAMKGSAWDRIMGAASIPGALPFGKIVYHGTPHTFAPTPRNPLGEFDLSKIGTGEGAQAYGHGIYLAENPNVAGTYKSQTLLTFKDPYRDGFLVQKPFSDDPPVRGFKTLEDAERYAKKQGKLYQVDLPDEHIARMLDWDAPMREQVRGVRDVFNQLHSPGLSTRDVGSGLVDVSLAMPGQLGRGGTVGAFPAQRIQEVLGDVSGYVPTRGSDFYRSLRNPFMAKRGGYKNWSGAGPSEFLRQRGVPGLRYFDQGSRVGGQGTRNIVLFDPSLARIQGVME